MEEHSVGCPYATWLKSDEQHLYNSTRRPWTFNTKYHAIPNAQIIIFIFYSNSFIQTVEVEKKKHIRSDPSDIRTNAKKKFQ